MSKRNHCFGDGLSHLLSCKVDTYEHQARVFKHVLISVCTDDMWEEWHKEKMARMKIEDPERYILYQKSSNISKRRTSVNFYEKERRQITADSCLICNRCGFYASRAKTMIHHHRKRHSDQRYWDVVRKVSLKALAETSEMKNIGYKKNRTVSVMKTSIPPQPENVNKGNGEKLLMPPPVYFPKRFERTPAWKSYFHYTFRTPDRPPSPDRTTKEGFLSALGLIPKDEVEEFSRPKCPKMRPAKIALNKILDKKINKHKHFRVCNKCDYFAIDKATVNEHKKAKHSVEIFAEFATKLFGDLLVARSRGEF